MANLKSKTKLQLEAIGREYGVELDRRKSKAALITEVEELLSHVDDCECDKTEDEFGKCDASHAKAEVLTEVPQIPASDLRGLLTDATGNILIFESKLKARSMGHKKDGRAVPFGDKWAIKKY
jgi:hypothetical protein